MKQFYTLLAIVVITTLSISRYDLMANEIAIKPIIQSTQLTNIDNNNHILYYEKQFDKLQGNTEFTIIDSLANGYSFYTNEQQPLMYYPEGNKLVMIKRGFGGASGTSADALNTLNNLFLVTSDDWGKTWDKPINIYNSLSNNSGNARYPSVYPFTYEDEFAVTFAAPVTEGSGWMGFVLGFYSDSYGSMTDKAYQFQDERNDTYIIQSTSSGLYSYVDDDESFHLLATSTVMPPEALRDLTNQSAFVMMEEIDMADQFLNVPEQWNSDKFEVVSDALAEPYNSTSSILSGMIADDEGNLYMCAEGAFLEGEREDSWNIAVSKSEDAGKTWSEFNLFPYSLVDAYGTKHGGNPDSTILRAGTNSFMVYGKDKYSMIVFLMSLDDNVGVFYHIVELSYDGTAWSIEKVADHFGYNYLIYEEDDPTKQATNQLNWELQLAKTVGGNKLLAKWVEWADIMDTEADTLIKAGTHDVFVCAKDIASNTWGNKVNVTNTPGYDRITWIPNIVPNDLTDIPLLKLMSASTASDATAYYRDQRDLLLKQYVVMSHFNLESNSVNDNTIENNFNFYGVFPNPAKDNVEITAEFNNYGHYSVEIYDVLGNKVLNVFDGFASQGIKSFVVNISSLTSGTYYCNITSNTGMITKTIIKTK